MFGISTAVAAVISFGVTALLGFWLIPMLRRLHFGQPIKEIGPTWHKKKEGTPTMGGLLFAIGISAAIVAAMALFPAEQRSAILPQSVVNARLWGCLLYTSRCV